MASKNFKIILLLALGIALFYYFDLGHYLSLQNLKANRDSLLRFYQQNPVLMIIGFVAGYITVTALSLPGATILTLAGGAIFGPVKAALLVNVGATLGATLAFLVARVLLRGWVEKKFGDKLRSFHDGVSNNAINYILFLRLVPAFPFFLVNLGLGLTQVTLRVYFLGTMIGILPGSFVYANAGSNLASINKLSDVASPGVLGAFALLGLFALLPTIYQRMKKK